MPVVNACLPEVVGSKRKPGEDLPLKYELADVLTSRASVLWRTRLFLRWLPVSLCRAVVLPAPRGCVHVVPRLIPSLFEASRGALDMYSMWVCVSVSVSVLGSS